MGGGTTPDKNLPSLPNIPVNKDDWARLRLFLVKTKSTIESLFQNPDPPDQVKNLTATAESGGISLTWDAANRATDYIVYRALNSNLFSDAKEACRFGRADALSFFDAGGQQTAGLSRTYWVLARNLFADGPLSTFVSATEPAAGAGTPGTDGIPILLPNHITDINLAATGSVTTLETVPSTAFAAAPGYLRNEGSAGNWLISFGGNTPTASSYSVKLGPGDSFLVTMGEAYKEANLPIGTVKAFHDNPSVTGHGALSGFISWNDGTSPLAGATGPQGAYGGAITLDYKFSTTTTNADPGSGLFRLNNATESSATALYINTTSFDAIDFSTMLANLTNSTSTNKAFLRIAKKSDITKWLIFYITAYTSHTGYKEFTLTNIASSASSPISNADECLLFIDEIGTKGDTGTTGQDGGLRYTFNTATSGDPGSGAFLFNNVTFASATQLNISETDANSNAVATLLTKIDDSTSTNKAMVIAVKQNGAAFFSFYITAALTDVGAYDTYPITPITSAGSISNGDTFHLTLALVGDKGDTGATGRDGGLRYAFNTATSGDPGSGAFLFNNATFASATQFNVSETDNDSNAVATLLTKIDDSSSVTNKAMLILIKQGGTAFFSFYITAALTDAGTYDTYPITPITKSGSISNGDVFSINFALIGDKGDIGGGDVQVSQVKRTAGDVTTTSTSFADLTGATVTITTGARRALIMFTCGTSHSANQGSVFYDLVIDGTSQSGGNFGMMAATTVVIGGVMPVHIHFMSAVLTSASHTFKIQWRVGSGTGTTYGAVSGNSQPYTFTVIETGLTA